MLRTYSTTQMREVAAELVTRSGVFLGVSISSENPGELR